MGQMVCDNLKSGIIKACFYEPQVNRSYAEIFEEFKLISLLDIRDAAGDADIQQVGFAFIGIDPDLGAAELSPTHVGRDRDALDIIAGYAMFFHFFYRV